MRRFVKTTIILGALTLAPLAVTTSAFAKSRGLETTITAPLTTPIKVEVIIGEDLAHRAENLPKKRRDRGQSTRRLNAGFANNGFYGTRDVNRLAERLQSKVEHRFTKKGIELDDNAPTTLRLVITDAKPNRPTFEQLSREVSLSLFSIALGGAEINGELIGADGQSLGAISYEFFEHDLRFSSKAGVWTDAYRAFDRFARRAAKSLVH